VDSNKSNRSSAGSKHGGHSRGSSGGSGGGGGSNSIHGHRDRDDGISCGFSVGISGEGSQYNDYSWAAPPPLSPPNNHGSKGTGSGAGADAEGVIEREQSFSAISRTRDTSFHISDIDGGFDNNDNFDRSSTSRGVGSGRVLRVDPNTLVVRVLL
jgi:hypothetical protein